MSELATGEYESANLICTSALLWEFKAPMRTAANLEGHSSSERQSSASPPFPWNDYLPELMVCQWRTPTLAGMVLHDIRALGGNCTVLDIGCGNGFDDHLESQSAIAKVAGKFVGVEPDPVVEIPAHFSEVHTASLETAPIAPASVDVAYAVMVLEHVEHPERFWNCLHRILKPGGVFWGFTVNRRHWFTAASRALSAIKAKSTYLELKHGPRGVDRYLDYPVHYRTNTIEDLRRHTVLFRTREVHAFGKIGIVDYYFPDALKPMARFFDRRHHDVTGQRINLAIRVQK